MPKRVTILGATGSIGLNTLDVIARHPDRFEAFALTANRRLEALFELCLKFHPRYAVVSSDEDAARLHKQLCDAGISDIEVLAGESGLVEVASHPEVDMVMAAIVGAAGLMPTLATAKAGKRVLLANKEALVVAGPLFMETVRRSGAELLPIDSEHNAIFQCMPPGYRAGTPPEGVTRILLTASGGPFLDTPKERLVSVTPEEAIAHPNWNMGPKISVDSATMMNKGLEVIEASLLFALPPDRIEVVIHPQSVIHSMVEYLDGSVLAQLGNPDMRTPIAYGLAWPERIPSGAQPLDLFKVGSLTFWPPDFEKFPCLKLAFEAAREGGTAPAILNAANEITVAAFLERKIPFTAISEIIARTLEKLPRTAVRTLEDVLTADRRARKIAESLVRTFSRQSRSEL